MIDRERKRQADRERRALIKQGKWDFPEGGSRERARAGLPTGRNDESSLARQRAAIPAQKPAEARKTDSFSSSKPLRHEKSSAPPSLALSFNQRQPGRELVPFPYTSRPSTEAGRLVKRASKCFIRPMAADGGRPPGPPLTIEMTRQQLGELVRDRRALQAEADYWRRHAVAAERVLAEARQAEADRVAERQGRVRGTISALAALFGIPIPETV